MTAAPNLENLTKIISAAVAEDGSKTRTAVADVEKRLNTTIVELLAQVGDLKLAIDGMQRTMAAKKSKTAAPATGEAADKTPKPLPSVKSAAFKILYETDEAFRTEFTIESVKEEFDKLTKKPKNPLQELGKRCFGEMTAAHQKGRPNKMDAFIKYVETYNANVAKNAPSEAENLKADESTD